MEIVRRRFRETAVKLGLDPDNPADPPEIAAAVEQEQQERLEELLDSVEKPQGVVRREEQEALRQLQQLINRTERSEPQRPNAPEQLTFDDVVERYLTSRRSDYQLITQANPDQLAKKRQLSYTTLQTIESHLRALSKFVGNKPWQGVEQCESVLRRYAEHLQQKVIKGEYAGWTVNTKLRKMHTFFDWCFTDGYVERPLRNLKKATASFGTEKGGQPLELEVIKKLWDTANDRMKCWISLGLNCGYYPIDASELQAEHFQGGRVIRKRKKTGALQNYKLWPITLDLIERTRMDLHQDTEGRLWITSRRNPLVADGRNLVTHNFRKLAKDADVKATFSQLRDTSAQQIEHYSRQKDRVDPALVSLFLSHKDQRTAAYYISDKPEDMNTKSLDQATDHLAEYYKLKLEPVGG